MYCFPEPIQTPACAPFWTWSIIGLFAFSVVTLFIASRKISSLMLKRAAARQAQENRDRLPDEYTLRQLKWPGDTAHDGELEDKEIERRVREAVDQRRHSARVANLSSESKWKYRGVRVVHANELDINTPQTPGMNRAAAITYARAGADKLWAGTVVIHPKAKTGAHHHGPVESVIYVVSGKARMRWGDQLEFMAEAGPGDFIYVPPYLPHQEINASDREPLSCVLVRSGQEPVVVNLDIPGVEEPEEVRWVDNLHPDPGKR